MAGLRVLKQILPFLLEELQAPSITIRVTDSTNGEPVSARIDIAEIPFAEGEDRTTDRFGTLRWRLPLGVYTENVVADGYVTQSREVTLDNSAITAEFVLEKSR